MIFASVKEAIYEAGINPPSALNMDGQLHRYHVDGDRIGSKNGWYVIYPDTPAAGCFGCWKKGVNMPWSMKPTSDMSEDEKAAYRAKLEAAKAYRDQEQAKVHEEAKVRANNIWKHATLANGEHPYLKTKRVQPHDIRISRNDLVVPVRNLETELVGLQFISPDGQKRFMSGTAKKGSYFSIGKPSGQLLICEGFATGSTLHEATGIAVAVAFDAGNLKPVAVAMREKFPEVRIVLCVDDDFNSEGNPGLIKGKEAALAVGGMVAVPKFPDRRGVKDTDFNDLAALSGLDEVKRQIDAVTSPPVPIVEQPVQSQAVSADTAKIQRLASLTDVEYERVRIAEAESLGCRTAILDQIVKDTRKEKQPTDGDFDDVEPWAQPVDAAALLSDISTSIIRFIICSQETASAVALWVAMTWFMDVVQVAPLAVITAPEKRCGKSQLLFLIGRLVYRPLTASNITPAALFRAVDAWKPTLLVDEADSFTRNNDELRGILNCGHTRDSAYIVRSVGEDHTPKKFNVWGAKALAGIGHLADTIMDRSIVWELRRKLPHETVERLRHAEPDLFETFTSKLARFAQDRSEDVRVARPDLPEVLNDRAQDNWEPLLAIADVAGGGWPKLAREVAVKLSKSDDTVHSVGTELLADVKEVFELKGSDRISTANLIKALSADEEKPWATYHQGKPITPREVSICLKEYGIKSKSVRIDYETPKGFKRDQFKDAFARYLSSPEIAATTPQDPVCVGSGVADDPTRCATENQNATRKPSDTAGCGGVADNLHQGDEKVIEVSEDVIEKAGWIK